MGSHKSKKNYILEW